MKFFIDTADIDEIREINSMGILDGVTTNPSLLSKVSHKGSFSEIIRAICREVHGSVFSPSQALLAAKAGATFVSPFIGRLDDISHIGMDIIQDIMTIYANYDYDTEVLVASVRHPLHVVEAARIGADVVTIPYDVIRKLVAHPLTDIGIARFAKDWEKVKTT